MGLMAMLNRGTIEDIFQLDPHEAQRRWQSLTPRQAAVASRLAQGMTNQEVAAELGIGPKTLDTHLMQVKYKLQAKTMAGIAAVFFVAQLIDRIASPSRDVLQEPVDLMRGPS